MRAMLVLFALILLGGCEAFDRGCASATKEGLGADWIIVQFDTDGIPINCWRLENTWVAGQSHAPNTYWWRSVAGHDITVTGWVNRVKVADKRWESAAYELGVDVLRCTSGKYLPKPRTDPPPGVKVKG